MIEVAKYRIFTKFYLHIYYFFIIIKHLVPRINYSSNYMTLFLGTTMQGLLIIYLKYLKVIIIAPDIQFEKKRNKFISHKNKYLKLTQNILRIKHKYFYGPQPRDNTTP